MRLLAVEELFALRIGAEILFAPFGKKIVAKSLALFGQRPNRVDKDLGIDILKKYWLIYLRAIDELFAKFK